MTKTLKNAMMILGAGAFLFFTSCSKDDDPTPEENENEVVTTVELHFKEQGAATELVYKWRDADGEGGDDPVIEDIVLEANKTYSVSIKLLDEVNGEDVTEEIEEESADHRFYYLPSNGANISVSELDKDGNGVTLGLESTWTTGAAAAGTIRIVLRHYPAGGKVESDTVTDPKSSTDADIEFVTSVE